MVEKVSRLLETLAAHGNLGLSELARRSLLSKSTVHRLSTELVELGLLIRHDGGYELGPRLSELGARVRRGLALEEVARPYVAELFATFRLTTAVWQMESSRLVTCVDKVWAVGQDPSYYWVGRGTRAPAHSTSAGKAIMAFSPPEVFDEVVHEPLVAEAPFAASGSQKLAAELWEIRSRGVAYMANEIRMNSASIAVPIILTDRRVVGALSCGLARSRASIRTAELESAMKTQARRIADAWSAIETSPDTPDHREERP